MCSLRLAHYTAHTGQVSQCIGGSRGHRQRPPPPNRIHFFRFRIHFHRKVYASQVCAPPAGRRPPKENPGSATAVGECLVLSVHHPVSDLPTSLGDLSSCLFLLHGERGRCIAHPTLPPILSQPVFAVPYIWSHR